MLLQGEPETWPGRRICPNAVWRRRGHDLLTVETRGGLFMTDRFPSSVGALLEAELPGHRGSRDGCMLK